MLERRLCDVLARVDPDLSAEVLEGPFRKLTHIERPPCTSLPDNQPKPKLAISRNLNLQSAEALDYDQPQSWLLN